MLILFKIWGRAMIIYTCCMLPFLAAILIFAYAVGLALIYGCGAFVLFALLMYGLRLLNVSTRIALWTTLLAGLLTTFAATYFASVAMTDSCQTVWNAMKENIVFPLVAWLSATASILSYRHSISRFFYKKSTRYVL